jgi:hypothetical protein
VALSSESSDLTSGFAAGVEFEETFPESTTPADPAPIKSGPPAQAPRLTVVRDEPKPREERTRREPPSDQSESLFQEQLDRRLREAEAMVKQTIESVRLEEERRLAEWVRTRREEEERRIAKWAEDRRTAIERSIEVRGTSADGVVRRIEDLLYEWQERFEERLDQRRVDDERLAERQRISDEERLRAWRGELERALTDRFSRRDRRASDRASGVRANTRDAIGQAASARDVGRALRDALADIARTSAFALALHGSNDDVAYRYRVASEDELGAALRGEALDDGPHSAAANADGWIYGQRTVRAGERNVAVNTAQCAVADGRSAIGVVTLQSEHPIAQPALDRIAALIAAAAPRLAELRDAGAFRAS